MAQSKLVLVTGATGKQGGAVVEALLTRGHRVRALTRNAASPAANRLREQGVEIAVGDLTDHDALLRATRGADAVYAMSTPYEQGAEKEIAQGITITVAQGITITYAVEKHLQASGVPYTIFAPVFFMENCCSRGCSRVCAREARYGIACQPLAATHYRGRHWGVRCNGH
jgi:uncharacterized protein YbjT (DUF2867 family)